MLNPTYEDLYYEVNLTVLMTDQAAVEETQHIAHSLLARAHSPTTANRIFTERVLHKPLPLRPSSPTPSARSTRRQARAARKAAAKKRQSRKPRPLSAAQKRALCLYDIPKAQQKYSIYEPLHRLWCGYMREILGLERDPGDPGSDGVARFERKGQYVSPAGAGPILASADMHGALVEVVRSRCVSRVGLKGIVVRDTMFVVEIVTSKDVMKTIPKEHTIFRFEVPLAAKEGQEELKPLMFEINGEQFKNRAPDRAKKSFKMHNQPDL